MAECPPRGRIQLGVSALPDLSTSRASALETRTSPDILHLGGLVSSEGASVTPADGQRTHGTGEWNHRVSEVFSDRVECLEIFSQYATLESPHFQSLVQDEYDSNVQLR